MLMYFFFLNFNLKAQMGDDGDGKWVSVGGRNVLF